MASAGTVYVDVQPDMKGFGSSLNRGMVNPVKSAVVGLGAAFAAVGAVKFLGGAISEAREAEKVMSQTNAVIKSTGGIAGITAEHVDTLATSISNKVGIDDEAIASGENLLLTFSSIRNEVGKGNQIFDRATQAAVDMSVAFKQDLKSSAIQVGKALQDPIKGVAALSRIGVTFTQQQKDQIKTLVESGNTLKAQKIILGEVERQVKGSAAAGADFGDKWTVMTGNIKETIGKALLPFIDIASTWLSEKLPGLVDAAVGLFTKLVLNIVSAVRAVITAFSSGGLIGVLQLLWERFNALDGPIKAVAGALGALAIALSVAQGISSVVELVTALGGSLGILLNPVTLTVIAIAALAAGAIYAYQNFETFRNIVDNVAAFFVDNVLPRIQQFVDYLRGQWENLAAWTREHWDAIQQAVSNVVTVVAAVVAAFVTYVQFMWNTFGEALLNQTRVVWDFIRSAVEAGLLAIQGIIEFVLGVLTLDWSRAWDGIKLYLEGAWQAMQAIVELAFGTIQSYIIAALSALGAAWAFAWAGIQAATQAAWDAIVGVTQTAMSTVTDVISFAWATITAVVSGALDTLRNVVMFGLGAIADFALTIWAGVIGGWETAWGVLTGIVTGAIDVIKGAWNAIAGTLNAIPDINFGPIHLGIPTIPYLASGGTARAGRAHLVGEQGPELFVPGRTGTVIPNHALTGNDGGDWEALLKATEETNERLAEIERNQNRGRPDPGPSMAHINGPRR